MHVNEFTYFPSLANKCTVAGVYCNGGKKEFTTTCWFYEHTVLLQCWKRDFNNHIMLFIDLLVCLNEGLINIFSHRPQYSAYSPTRTTKVTEKTVTSKE